MFGLGLDDLFAYTQWERQKWYGWLRSHGDEVLCRLNEMRHGLTSRAKSGYSS
jgi:hypothetical protein